MTQEDVGGKEVALYHVLHFIKDYFGEFYDNGKKYNLWIKFEKNDLE